MKTVAAILKHKGYQVTTVEPTATIAHVVDVLAEHRIGAVLVIDHTDQLLGIIGDAKSCTPSQRMVRARWRWPRDK
jgi:CBS domain-containing protein